MRQALQSAAIRGRLLPDMRSLSRYGPIHECRLYAFHTPASYITPVDIFLTVLSAQCSYKLSTHLISHSYQMGGHFVCGPYVQQCIVIVCHRTWSPRRIRTLHRSCQCRRTSDGGELQPAPACCMLVATFRFITNTHVSEVLSETGHHMHIHSHM